MKTFADEIKKFRELLVNKTNFAFTRFSDGELFVLQNKEVILAIKPSIEGETTALYISKILENSGVKVSKIAHGVPIGVDMEYIDSLTLELALEDRTEIS